MTDYNTIPDDEYQAFGSAQLDDLMADSWERQKQATEDANRQVEQAQREADEASQRVVLAQQMSATLRQPPPPPIAPAPSPAPAPQSPMGRYDTALSPDEERAFQAWKQQYAPRDSGEDYDLR